MPEVNPIANSQNDTFIEVDAGSGCGCKEKITYDSCSDRAIKREIKILQHNQEDVECDIKSLQKESSSLFDAQKTSLKARSII